MESTELNRLVSIKFNQDHSCFVCGTERGFQVFTSYPFKDTFQRVLGGGLGAVEMFYKSNILAMVGGGTHPKYPTNKAVIWDDQQAKCIGELSFKTPVITVKLRKDKVVVVLESRIYVYNFADFYFLDGIDTYLNPLGCCALTGTGAAILATPTKNQGEIRIKNYTTGACIEKRAHDSAIVVIALSPDGKLCATASKKGTLVRIFSTDNGRLLQELRRGKDKAHINSIAFDKTNTWIACTSNKGTVHIFTVLSSTKAASLALSLEEQTLHQSPRSVSSSSSEAKEEPKEEKKKVDPRNPTSMFKFMRGIVPYFSSEWSFAQFRISEKFAFVGFGPTEKNCIVVVTDSGKYYLAEFDPKVGGECKKIDERTIPLLQE